MANTQKLALTRKEAAQRLGVSLPSLDAFLRRSKSPLPHFRIGRKVVIPVASLDEWLNEEARRHV